MVGCIEGFPVGETVLSLSFAGFMSSALAMFMKRLILLCLVEPSCGLSFLFRRRGVSCLEKALFLSFIQVISGLKKKLRGLVPKLLTREKFVLMPWQRLDPHKIIGSALSNLNILYNRPTRFRDGTKCLGLDTSYMLQELGERRNTLGGPVFETSALHRDQTHAEIIWRFF